VSVSYCSYCGDIRRYKISGNDAYVLISAVKRKNTYVYYMKKMKAELFYQS